MSELHGLGIDPSYGAASLQAETCTVRKAHSEIIGISCVRQSLHMVDGTAQIVRAEHLAVLDLRYRPIVTAVYAQIYITMPQNMFKAFIIASPEAILRIVKSEAMRPFDEIDRIGMRHFSILFQEPWECILRIIMYIAPGGKNGFPFASFESSKSTAQMAILFDGIDVVREIYMPKTGFQQWYIQLLEHQARVLIQTRDENTTALPEDGEPRRKAPMFIALRVDQFFSARGEEEGGINDVGADDGFTFGWLFHHRFAELRKYKVFA